MDTSRPCADQNSILRLTFIGDWKKPSEKKRREKKGAKEDADAATASAQPDPGQFGYPPQSPPAYSQFLFFPLCGVVKFLIGL